MDALVTIRRVESTFAIARINKMPLQLYPGACATLYRVRLIGSYTLIINSSHTFHLFLPRRVLFAFSQRPRFVFLFPTPHHFRFPDQSGCAIVCAYRANKPFRRRATRAIARLQWNCEISNTKIQRFLSIGQFLFEKRK